MGKRIVPRSPDPKKASDGPPKGLTLANITVTHAIGLGRRPAKYTGETLVRLIEASQHLYDRDSGHQDLDFINPYAIAIELEGVADVLCGLAETEEFALTRALPCLGDQLRRIGHRVTALAERRGISAPNWYTVQVKK